VPINNEYKRYFIILQEDSKNYGMGSGKTPAGYVKIEVKNGNCKLSTFVQNMKADKNLDYKLLMVSPIGGIGLEMGRILIDSSGRGELNSEVNPNNVMNSGHNISEFTVAAVYEGDRFPLGGYLGRDKVNWKGKYTLANGVKAESKPIKNIMKPVEYKSIENRVMPVENKPIENRVMPVENKPIENRVMPVENKPIENRVMPVENKPIENRVMPVENKPIENMIMPVENKPIENMVMPVENKAIENKAIENMVMPAENKPIENMVMPVENKEYEGIEYKCRNMCEKQPMEVPKDECDDEMLRGIGRALRKLPRCRLLNEDDWECFRIEDNMKYINKASIRYCGQTTPMSYPLLKDDFLMKHLNDCMIGVKYDEMGENIRHLMYAIPGDNMRQLRRYYGDIGFTDYRNGYYLMYIDI